MTRRLVSVRAALAAVPVLLAFALAPQGALALANLGGIAKITAGDSHTCAVTTGGAVKCWGENFGRQLGNGTTVNAIVPSDTLTLSSGIAAVAGGEYHSCALTVEGAVKCWGENSSGQLGIGSTTPSAAPAPVSGLSGGVAAIAARTWHSCALTTGGAVKCWGDNGYGQLGNGTTTGATAPVAVSTLSSGIQAIVAGRYHSCALTAAGAVKCWGYNGMGQLGNGSTNDALTPVDVPALASGVQAIAAGAYHTCALTTAGAVKCWGNNGSGQLGNNSQAQAASPVNVFSLSSGVIALAAGEHHSCALLASGQVMCWGFNNTGQLGSGTTNQALTPVAVSTLSSGVASITAGSDHTCALLASGGVKCWGQNGSGELGNGASSISTTPVPVSLFSDALQSVVAGWNHTCALTNGGGVKCWGDNTQGQLGNGSYARSVIQAMYVSGLASGVAAIVAGDYHTCALTVTGAVKCWGSNYRGQLGNGSTITSPVPVNVTTLSSGVTAITAGSTHTCAVVDGAAKCWGDNFDGQLGNASTFQATTPVDVATLSSGIAAIGAGAFHSCALTTSGAVKCWGYNGFGQLGNGSAGGPAPTDVLTLSSGVARIAVGNTHNCVVMAAGAAKCWGSDFYGELGNHSASPGPVDVANLSSGVAAVAAGDAYSCALTTGGAVKCWGRNVEGQLGNGSTANADVPAEVSNLTSGIVAIAAGDSHACAVMSGGGARCWGDRFFGTLGDGTAGYSTVATSVVRYGSIADLNGDGRSDILYRNTANGQVFRLLMNGPAVTNGALAYAEPNTAWTIVGDADFNGDGVADLLWRNSSNGQVYVMPFNTSGAPAGGAVVHVEANAAWKIIHTPDLNGDGKADLLWWNSSTGQVYAMLMNGFSATLQNFVYTEPNTAWKIVVVGDFSGSGKQNQLLYRNSTTGQVFLMTVSVSGGGFTQTGQMIYQEPNTAWKIIAAADFSGDGKSDLLWRNDSTGQVYMMLMNGGAIANQNMIHHEPNLAWKVVAHGDYNGDGKADLLWRNESTGQIYMMLMNGLFIANQAMVYQEGNLDWKVLGTREYGLASGMLGP